MVGGQVDYAVEVAVGKLRRGCEEICGDGFEQGAQVFFVEVEVFVGEQVFEDVFEAFCEGGW